MKAYVVWFIIVRSLLIVKTLLLPKMKKFWELHCKKKVMFRYLVYGIYLMLQLILHLQKETSSVWLYWLYAAYRHKVKVIISGKLLIECFMGLVNNYYKSGWLLLKVGENVLISKLKDAAIFMILTIQLRIVLCMVLRIHRRCLCLFKNCYKIR